MKAERAAEIAHRLRYKMALGQYAVDLIADSIMQACNEQREADAKIAEAAQLECAQSITATTTGIEKAILMGAEKQAGKIAAVIRGLE